MGTLTILWVLGVLRLEMMVAPNLQFSSLYKLVLSLRIVLQRGGNNWFLKTAICIVLV